jgi:hypothetical protein
MDDFQTFSTTKSGLRGAVSLTLYTMRVPVTIADNAGGNTAVSIFGTGQGSRKIPAYTIAQGKMFWVGQKLVLNCRNGKISTLTVSLGSASFSSTLTYSSNIAGGYADLDCDLIVSSLTGNLATVNVMGRTQFAATTGSNVYTRFLVGTLANVDITIDNTFDITFLWDNANYNAGNSIVSTTVSFQLYN